MSVVIVPVSELVPGQVLMGDNGGRSIITEVNESYMILGCFAVETEHGTLYLDAEDEVAVVDASTTLPPPRLANDRAPFIITFHAEADGGPEHFVDLLVGYTIVLYKAGVPLFGGRSLSVLWEEGGNLVALLCREEHGDFGGEIVSVPIFDDTFDEIEYQ